MAAAGSNTRLAAERNRLALERTLMAWTRTSTSLIAFGFTIYQIFRYLSQNDRLRDPYVSPQVLDFAMIVGGWARSSWAGLNIARRCGHSRQSSVRCAARPSRSSPP